MKKLPKRLQVSTARKIAGALMPLFEKYDSIGEAKTLLKDPDLKNSGIDLPTAAEYLRQSERDHRWLYRWGKLADGADRLTSMVVAPALSTLGTVVGLAPGFVAGQFTEEAIESVFKIPFYAQLLRRYGSHEAVRLASWEAGTSVVPFVGNIYDIVNSMYANSAKRTIREEAKSRLMGDLESRVQLK